MALAHGGQVAVVAATATALPATATALVATATALPATATALVATFDAAPGAADHAERALRCGLAWLVVAQADTTRHRSTLGPYGCRVGAHTGPAAAGRDAHGNPDGTAQAAGHIADEAAPGRLCISQQVAALVRGQFDVEPPLPLAVPAGPMPLQTSALRPAGPPAAGASGGDAVDLRRPMVGRQAALGALQAALACRVVGRQAAVVTVLADAGLGKSRLLREFDACLQARPLPHHVPRGLATAQAQGQPFGLLGGLLRGFFQIDLDRPPQAVRAQFDRAVLPWFLAQGDAVTAEFHAHALGHLLGVEFADSAHLQGVLTAPKPIRQAAFNAAAQLLRQLSAEGNAPVLLLIEDLHWADSDTLDFLDHLVKANHDTALLIVSTSRPTLADRRAAWTRTEGAHTRLDLGALDLAGCRDLARGLLRGLAELPPALLDLVVEASAGNPYCIEERVNLLLDQGVIVAAVGGWTVSAAKLRAARLPDTLAGVLQARLAVLPAAERRALQQASVIGRVFPEAALLALGAAAVRVMQGLMQRELTFTHQPAGGNAVAAFAAGGSGGPRQFSFKHQLLQQLAYDSVPAPMRRSLHGKLARWLVGLGDAQTREAPGLSAHHFEQAGDDARAAEQHARAAEQASGRFALEALATHVQRGLALLDGLPASPVHHEMRWRLLQVRVFMFEHLGDHRQHRADLDDMAAVADALADDTKRALAAQRRSRFLMFTTDFAGMKIAALQTLVFATRAGEHRHRLAALRTLALAHCYLGDWDAGDRLARQCLAQSRDLGQWSIVTACMNTLSLIARHRQDLVALLRWTEQALVVDRQLGGQRGIAISLTNLGGAWLDLGALVEARRYCEEALRLARALGHRFSEGGVLCSLSKLERWQGNGLQAVALAQQAVQILQALGLPQWHSLALYRLGDAHLAAGQPAAAAQAYALQHALALAHKIPQVADATAGLARSALALGDLPGALQHLQQVLALDAASGAVRDAEAPRRVELVCHLVLARAGDARATAWLQRAHAELLVTAANISDAALREGFLNNIPDHRAILAAWVLHENENEHEAAGQPGGRPAP